jgi:hypothetical protein
MSRPILTVCPTLHQLAQEMIEHMPGKTLEQVRNEIDMGLVGSRSSVAFRHTVLREKVLPTVAETNGIKKLGIRKKLSTQEQIGGEEEEVKLGVHAMNSTHTHSHCYDLVEDSLLSMIFERMPIPRKDDNMESYSPTMGGPFRMYSPSARSKPMAIEDDMLHHDESTEQENESMSPFDVGDWQRKSPSSFYLFGDGSSNSLNMSGLLIQQLKQSMNNRIKRSPGHAPMGDVSEERPVVTYLQLLDMYGNEDNREDEEQNKDDWLEYVDNHYHRSTTA